MYKNILNPPYPVGKCMFSDTVDLEYTSMC